jgi:tetratricopeptide (TPR) repeat protein
MTAQYLQDMGDRDLAAGRYAAAVQHYTAAQRFDVQLTRSEEMYLRLGEAYYKWGNSSQPHARLYLGHRDAQQGNLEAAIATYALAAQTASNPLQEIIRKRMAWTYAGMGMTEYHKKSVGRATALWEHALAIDAAQLQVAYFLTKAYFDLKQYERSIAIGHFLLARSQNRLLNANTQANMGDSYWERHDFTRARQAYKASMRLDAHRNLRIFKSLAGT